MYLDRCHVGDYLKLFLHLEEEGVNERTPWNSLICGEYKNQTFSSASRHLVLQFHSTSLPLEDLLMHVVKPLSHTSPSNSASTTAFGFHGLFRFLNASKFTTPFSKILIYFHSVHINTIYEKFSLYIPYLFWGCL